MVEGVDNQPSIHIAKDKEDPKQTHDDVVSKDHVIDNGCIDDDKRSPDSEDGHTPDPRFQTHFHFLKKKKRTSFSMFLFYSDY